MPVSEQPARTPDSPSRPRKALTIGAGSSKDTSVYLSLDLSWQQLSAEQRRVLARLSAFFAESTVDALLMRAAGLDRMPYKEAVGTLYNHSLLRERADRPAVETGREAKVSLQHSAAVALLEGAAGRAQYEDSCVADPVARALRAKVVFEDEEAARTAVQRISSAPRPEFMRVDSIELREVVAHF